MIGASCRRQPRALTGGQILKLKCMKTMKTNRTGRRCFSVQTDWQPAVVQTTYILRAIVESFCMDHARTARLLPALPSIALLAVPQSVAANVARRPLPSAPCDESRSPNNTSGHDPALQVPPESLAPSASESAHAASEQFVLEQFWFFQVGLKVCFVFHTTAELPQSNFRVVESLISAFIPMYFHIICPFSWACASEKFNLICFVLCRNFTICHRFKYCMIICCVRRRVQLNPTNRPLLLPKTNSYCRNARFTLRRCHDREQPLYFSPSRLLPQNYRPQLHPTLPKCLYPQCGV
jgi:hypothetical protein